MFKKENLILLQQKIKESGLKGYLILTGDPHNSEYAADYFLELRKYFCPFSGSAGELLVLENDAYLFADGRYWIQAENELAGSGIKVVRCGDKGALNFDEFIAKNKISPLGVDLKYFVENQYLKFKQLNIDVKDVDFSNLIKNRPALSKNKLFELSSNLNTLTREEKIENIYKKIKEAGAEANLITTLDDIAWILNIRGNDIPNNPVFYSYLFLSEKLGNHLFIDKSKVLFKIDGINLHDYDEIDQFLSKIGDCEVLLDPNRVNAHLYNLVKNPVAGTNPSYLMKCIKGVKEAENIKRIQAVDGLALVKFKKYLKENLDKGLSEFQYSEKLKEYRLSNKECFELSFDTIAAVGPNAAQMHYEPTKDKSSIVDSSNIELLVDSGGQYYGGTTDTTRTFLVGKPTDEFIHDYTLTLKAVINLSKTIFLNGSNGQTIDIRARELMWQEGMDYKCGTGHGVGYILNVHEGPNGFRYKKVKDRDDQGNIVPGMVTTIEPGVYKENKYGIRIENNLLCVNAFETSDGVFYKFETITYVPIDREALDLKLLSSDEVNWLNDYHKVVYEKLSVLTDDPELLSFLKEETKPIIIK